MRSRSPRPLRQVWPRRWKSSPEAEAYVYSPLTNRLQLNVLWQHSYIANGLGGNNGSLVIDLSKMKAITVRASNNTALIETGNRLGDIALALNAAGRALPHGTCSYVRTAKRCPRFELMTGTVRSELVVTVVMAALDLRVVRGV
jgi:hypothetical protein